MRSPLPICLVIFLLALVIRVGGPADATLKEFPPGLWFDEGLNGVDAWNTLHGGGMRLVYPDVFPREPLLVWMLSIALWLGGPQVLVMRLVTVFLGSLACAAFYCMLRRLYPERPAGFAAAAGFVLATLHWHAWFSRLVFRTNLIPLAACLLVWAMSVAARKTDRRQFWAWIGAGALAGLGFYVYLSWYFFLPVIALWYWALAGKNPVSAVKDAPSSAEEELSENRPGTSGNDPRRMALYFAAGAALVVLPILLHYLFHPADLASRPQAVSPLRDGMGAAVLLFLRNTRDVILMFGIRGDHVPLHNIPWSPVLDPVWFVFFAAGFARLAWEALRGTERGDRRAAAWLGWLACMSLPSVVTQTDSANTLRNLGATPAVAFFVAYGWWWAFDAARRSFAGRKRQAGAYVAPLLMALFLWGGGFQVVKLWVLHPRNPETASKFANFPVVLAGYCTPDPAESPLFLPPALMNKSFEFLTIGRGDIRAFDPVQALSRPENGEARDHRVLCSLFFPYYPVLLDLFPEGQVEEAKLFQSGQPVAWIFRIPARALLSREDAEKAAPRFAIASY